VPKTYADLTAEGKKKIDEWQEKWADKAKKGEWKKGVDTAIEEGRNPGAGIAAKLGLTVGDMANSVTGYWEEVLEGKTEKDHEDGVDAAARLNKWRARYLFKVTK